MEEIKIGEYVRTKEGSIFQIIGQRKRVDHILYDTDNFGICSSTVLQENVKNHSKNIIDLIEVGDYVNGYKVVNDNLESKEYGKYVDVYCPSQNLKLEFLEHVFTEQIKSIVTKEKFESECYKAEVDK